MLSRHGAQGQRLNLASDQTRGLVAYYPLNETVHNVAYDYVNRKNGTHIDPTNASTSISPFGTATKFGSGYYDIGNQSFLNFAGGDFGISFLVKRVATGVEALLSKDLDGGRQLVVRMNYQAAGDMCIVLLGASPPGNYELRWAPTGAVPALKWTRVAITRYNGVISIWINGIKQSLSSTSNGGEGDGIVISSVSTAKILIGAVLSGGTATAQASSALQDLRIYNRGLSPADVIDIYLNPLNIWAAKRQLQTSQTIGTGVATASRTIGTKAAYTTGTVSTSANGMTVTLTGGSFDTGWGEGDAITIMGVTSFVASRTNATTLVLQNAAFANLTGQTYTIRRAYATLATWVAVCPADLVVANIIYKGLCCNDSVFTAGCTMTGITANSTHYIWLTVPAGQRHNDNIYGNGVVFDYTGQTANIEITSSVAYTLIEWLHVRNANYSALTYANANILGVAGTGSTIKNCIVHNCVVSGTSGSCTVRAIYCITGSVVYNCLVYNITVTSVYYGATNVGIGLDVGAACLNNTVYNCKLGVSNSGYGVRVANTIAMGNPSGDFYSVYGVWTNTTNNLSSDATAPGTSSLINKVAANQFNSITAASEDFALRQSGDAKVSGITADAIGAGLDLSSSFDSDIRAIPTRSSTWDMGSRQHSVITAKTVGATARDYTSITTWAAACPANLVTSGVIWKALLYKDSAMAANQSIQNSFAGTDSYVWVTTGPGQKHTGKPGTGFVIDCLNSGYYCGFNLGSYTNSVALWYSVIENLEIKDCAAAADQRGAIYISSRYCHIRNCLIYNTTITQGFGLYSTMGNAGRNNYYYNNVIWNMYAGIYEFINDISIANMFINNTVYGCTYGVQTQTFSIFINNIILGNTTDFGCGSGTGLYTTSGYNAYQTYTNKAPGSTGNITTETPATAFYNYATKDFRLKYGSLCKYAGQTQTLFTKDVLDATRTPPWDMGAFLFYSLFTPAWANQSTRYLADPILGGLYR